MTAPAKPLKHARQRTLYHPTAERRLMKGIDGVVQGSGRLTYDEETRLFKALSYAAYATNKAESRRSRRRARRWRERYEAIRDRLVRGNVGLVYDLVRRTPHRNVESDELIGEGLLTLVQAIDAFDPWRGFRFSTYACNSILRAISRLSLAESKRRKRSPVNFDPELEGGDAQELERASSDELYRERMRIALDDAETGLTKVEREVLAERFPLEDGSRRRTLNEIGSAIRVSKERVRQIQNSALSKLRDALLADPALR